MSDYIPNDVLTKILAYLPPKLLVRFTSVSKSWQSLIKSSDVITHHLNQTRASNDRDGNHLILLRYNPYYQGGEFFLHTDNNNDDTFHLYQSLDFHFPKYCSDIHVLGCCNGLICLSDNTLRTTIILWNPTIRKYLTLPFPRNRYPPTSYPCYSRADRVYGFGFDSRTNDYKVVRLVYFISKDARSKFFRAELYKLSTGRWKAITATIDSYCFANFSPVGTAFVNGSIHWRASKDGPRDVILSFDMSEEVFREIMLPESHDMAENAGTDVHVAVCGEWLSFFHTYRTDSNHCSVWVMTEYGVVESWSKLYTIDLDGGLEMALGFRKNCELILAKKNGELVSYDSETGQIKYLGNSHLYGVFRKGVNRSQFTVDAYVESLVLLGDANRLGSGLVKQATKKRRSPQS